MVTKGGDTQVKVFLIYDDRRYPCDAFPDFAEVRGPGGCPKCGAHPLRVQGTGRRIAADDRAYEADAVAMCCSKPVGIARAEVDTLFGVREDEAMSRLGVKIY